MTIFTACAGAAIGLASSCIPSIRTAVYGGVWNGCAALRLRDATTPERIARGLEGVGSLLLIGAGCSAAGLVSMWVSTTIAGP